MDYRGLVNSSPVNFGVHDRLIECGSTTWQIRNIAATSIGRYVVPFTVPEPQFDTPEPSMALDANAMLIVAAFAGLGVYFGMLIPAIVAALAVVGLFVFLAAQAAEPRACYELLRNLLILLENSSFPVDSK